MNDLVQIIPMTTRASIAFLVGHSSGLAERRLMTALRAE